jgi:hypothetical protein
MLAFERWARSKRLAIYVAALICATFGVFSTTSESQVSGADPQEIPLKADAATLCALVGGMQVIAFRYSDDPPSADPREFEQYAVGYTRARNILVFGRQVKGYAENQLKKSAPKCRVGEIFGSTE